MALADRNQAPLSRRVVVLATAVIALTLFAATFDRRRRQTGELRIQADVPEVHVSIRKGEDLIFAPTDRRSFTLLPGDYEVQAEVGSMTLPVEPHLVTIHPQKRAVVRVRTPSP